MTERLRWAMIGASHIAATRLLPAIRAVGDTAVVVRSGDAGHGAAWAGLHGVEDFVTDLRAALERDDVDAVYVSSVNASHREHVEAAAAAGKHVLAEKPLALSLGDAVAMVGGLPWRRRCHGDQPPPAGITDAPNAQAGRRRRPRGGTYARCGCTMRSSGRTVWRAGASTLIDNIGGAAAATQHLPAHGQERIALVTDRLSIWTAGQRRVGFEEGVARSVIPLDQRYVVTDVQNGEQAPLRFIGCCR